MNTWIQNLISIISSLIILVSYCSPSHSLQFHKKRNVILSQNNHNGEVLKSVADRITGILNSMHLSDLGERDAIKNAKDLKASSPLKTVDDQNAPTDVQFFEALSHMVLEESEKVHKRQNGVQLKEPKEEPRSKARSDVSNKINNPTLVQTRSEVSNIFQKKPDDKQTKISDRAGKSPSEKTAGIVKTNPAVSFVPSSAADKRSREESSTVLKLTPHVVFTDSEGREYRLVGVGRPSGSQLDCSRECLAVDDASEHVLAYQSPINSDFLVLSDSYGDEFYTSGVSMCSNADELEPVNLAYLVPHTKREILAKKGTVSVKWKDGFTTKRKRYEEPKKFDEEVQNLFNGEAIGTRSNKPAASSSELFSDVPEKRLRRRFLKRYKADRHSRSVIDHKNDKEEPVNEADNRLEKKQVDPPINPLQRKLIDELGSEKNNLEEYSHGKKAKIDVERCKRHCEAAGAHLERRASDIEHQRAKRATEFNLIPPKMDADNPRRGLATGREFLSMDVMPENREKAKSEYKIIRFETNVEPKASEKLNPPMSEEEINMVQPTTETDEEDKMLLPKVTIKSEEAKKLPRYPKEIEENANSSLGEMEWSAMSSDEETKEFSTESPPWEPIKTHHQQQSSEELAAQLEQDVLVRVLNSPDMKEAIGPAIDFTPFETVPTTVEPPKYSSALNVLIKAFMVNVEKLAEDELLSRNCITLESELSDFLSQLLNLSYRAMPKEYQNNMQQEPSFQDLALRKNKLVELLKEFGQLSRKEQEETSGVKTFVESELRAIENQSKHLTEPHLHSRVIRAEIPKNFVSEQIQNYKVAAQEWFKKLNLLADEKLKHFHTLNPIRPKPFVEVKPYPKLDDHVPLPKESSD